jgi:CheY-like chemotaxis protein
VDLAAVVAQVLAAVKPLFDERRHRLTVSLPDVPLPLDADPTRLEQVATNLLRNAARYTDPGGRIAVQVVSEGGQAVMRVADTGIGLRPEMRERIFEPFVQAERSAQRPPEGLGIGLTLVRSLVALHGGSVSAASGGPGQGSEFTVRLPLAEGAPERVQPSPAPPAPAVPAGRSRRVLVVDDNVDGAESMAMMLRQGGHEALTAYDGRAALEHARRGRFDVVLLDIGLPDGLDGYEVARRLRSGESPSGAVLIALTGFGQEQDHRRSREAGFAHHLVKPVDPAELRRLLDRL